jgi:NADP-dependent aldehyde dehydrogenase
MHEPELARQAFPAFRRLTPARRAEFLDAIAEEIEALGDPLLETAARETHLPLVRLTGERGRTCAQIRMFAKLLADGRAQERVEEEAIPTRTPAPKPRLVRIDQPIGPVAVFGASNFPLAFSVAGGDTASALAAGCPVVAKAHPAHLETCRLAAQAIHRAAQRTHMPDGVFHLVEGGAETGQALVAHPAIAAVGFTGSYRAGRALWETANARPVPIPVFAEMGSVNPVVVLPEAQTDAWAEAFVASMTLGVGQFCTKPGLVLGYGPRFGGWLEGVAHRLDQLQPEPMLTPAILAAYQDGVEGWRTRAKELTQPRKGSSPALFQAPASENLAQEVFGPCAVAVEYERSGDLIEAIEALPGQLTGTVLGDPTAEEFRNIAEALAQKAGRVIANGMPTGVEVGPAMHHGGPWPASTDSRFTSVGTAAIRRWLRPVCFQNFPPGSL